MFHEAGAVNSKCDKESGPVTPLLDMEGVGASEEAMGEEIKCEESEDDDLRGEEAMAARMLRDPGAPTQKEVDEHCVTHMPFRAWRPSCVAGKARDKHHRQREQDDKGIPEVVFDYCFMGTEGEEETVAIQVERDRRSKAIFAHGVPRKGMTHEYGAEVLINDLDKLGYREIILKSDGEPALRSI